MPIYTASHDDLPGGFLEPSTQDLRQIVIEVRGNARIDAADAVDTVPIKLYIGSCDKVYTDSLMLQIVSKNKAILLDNFYVQDIISQYLVRTINLLYRKELSC